MEGHITALRRHGKIGIRGSDWGLFVACWAAMPRQVTVDELAQMLAASLPVKLVDVRQSWEHDTARLPASTLIPLPDLDERWVELRPPPEALPEALPETLIITYCHHGVRSLGAAALLEARGIGPVASLAGGIDAWSRHIDPTIPRY